jgi:hypothetical protein
VGEDQLEKEESIFEQEEQRWFIDLNWHRKNNRSFSILARDSLCAKCRKQLKNKELAAKDLIANIKDCCSGAPEFITERVPLLESVFRLFLANGNQPLTLEELSQRLSRRREGGGSRASVEVLSRLLASDRYYGLQPVQD